MKKTEEKLQVPCLDENGIDGRRIYKYRQWLERFKQNTKRKYRIDIRPPIKEVTVTETEWNTKENKLYQGFFRHLHPNQHIKKHDLNIETNHSK